MADRIVIAGSGAYDGSYDLDVEDEPFTTLEWRWIKQLSGYMPMSVNDGFQGADPDLIVALSVIALVRAAKIREDQVLAVGNHLARLPFDGDHIDYQPEPAEDADPPPSASGADQSSSSNGSGDGSTQPSETPANGPSRTGSPASVRSVVSAPATFET